MAYWKKKPYWTVLLVFFPLLAQGQQLELPKNLIPLALSESITHAFTPLNLQTTDFEIQPADGTPDPNIQLSLGLNSLQWVRVGQVLVVPRGLLSVQIQNSPSATLSNTQTTLPLHLKDSSTLEAEIPILLTSGKKNPIQVSYQDHRGVTHQKTYLLVFHPKSPAQNGQVITDVSCSPFQVTGTFVNPVPGNWAYLGCRYVHRGGSHYNVPTLELFVYWDGEDVPVTSQSIPIDPTSSSTWLFSLRSKPGQLNLQRGKTRLHIQYAIAERDRKFFLGVGIGPYQYYFEDRSTQLNHIAPLITGYWSLRTGETHRLVGFVAAPIASRSFIDAGIYFSTEQFRILDEHLTLNLLLGGHAIGFFDHKQAYFPFSFPQGIELIYRDFLGKRRNLAFGGFLYPQISGRSYYNVWLRWGAPSLFAELNYISWKEPTSDTTSVYSRSAGISVGFPLFSLF